MAAEGELAEPRIPSPALIRPILGFSRLSAAAYGRLRQAVDEDDGFRERVAGSADESVVGRAGHLWLTRPEGWEADPVFAEPVTEPAATVRRRAKDPAGVGDKLAKARDKAARADEGRRRAQEQRDIAVAELAQVRAELAEAVERIVALEADRNTAIRTQKSTEAALAETRRDLKVARAAAREAEEELIEQRAGLGGDRGASKRRAPGAVAEHVDRGPAGEGSVRGTAALPGPGGPGVGAPEAGGNRPVAGGSTGGSEARGTAFGGNADASTSSPAGPGVTIGPASTVGPEVDGIAARAAVSAAAAAAAELARALDAAAHALAPGAEEGGTGRTTAGLGGALGEAADERLVDARLADARSGGRRGGPGAGASGKARPGRRGGQRRPKRRAPSLPPGVFDNSPEARRHLVSDPEVVVVVDGYNLAREAWAGLEPEEERRRTIALLEEVAIRAGSSVVVVFDGDDSAVAPAASRVVRVRFSATGITADDEIGDLVAAIPGDQPVLVVSSDRAVAAEARANGAVSLSSAELLAAVGR